MRLFIGVAMIWISGCIFGAGFCKAEEPTCVEVATQNANLTEALAYVQGSIFEVCSAGSTFEVVDQDGNVYKFYCSQVTEL